MTAPDAAPGRPGGSGAGALVPGADAPDAGERTVALARGDGFTVEQILTGALTGPQEYLQDHDEWVLVVEGAAELEVEGVVRSLGAGDWCLLPAGVSHTLVRAAPGTSWVAVRAAGRRPGR